jgi:hypothetical protein
MMQAKGARQRDLDGEFSELIGPLDPVFSQFSRCETDVQFNLALEELFDLMDDDHSGIVSFLLCSYVWSVSSSLPVLVYSFLCVGISDVFCVCALSIIFLCEHMPFCVSFIYFSTLN